MEMNDELRGNSLVPTGEMDSSSMACLGTSLSRVHRPLDASNPMTGPGRAFSGRLVRGEDPRQTLTISSFRVF